MGLRMKESHVVCLPAPMRRCHVVLRGDDGHGAAVEGAQRGKPWREVYAGALVFCPVRGRRFSFMEEGRRSRFWVLFAVGSGVGFVAGLTGAGGPVLSVPIMIALGFPPLIAIGAGQVYSVPVALSGSAANFLHGAIDYKVGALMIVIQILGILLGVYMANRMDTTKLRKMVAWVCLFCGGFILVNAIRGILAM